MKSKKLLCSLLSLGFMMSSSCSAIFAIENSYAPGVTVEANTTGENTDSDYIVTFVYEDIDDEREAVKVELTGGFQFYNPDEVGDYNAAGDNSAIPSYTAYEYEKGMFPAGYGINNDTAIYELKQIEGERFEIALPLPADLYYYDYVVYYDDGSSVTIQDPANPSPANAFNGHDAGHSLVYVGDSTTAIAGQEYVYPRTDGKTGTYSFVTYTAIDGTEQPLGVYLPYGYDASQTYKTIYVSHGGGGNEAEWMSIGAIPNIMDNLIAEGSVADAIVVTMDNTHFGWDNDTIVPNVVDYIIPYIEDNYSVSTEAKDRAFCGLSMGSMTTNMMLRNVPGEFGYYGPFSGGNRDLDGNNYDAEALNNVTIYMTAGCIDMALNNNQGISSVDFMEMLDSINVDYTFELKNGAHDWYVWRDSFTTFVKDVLWDNISVDETENPIEDEINDGNEETPTEEEVVQEDSKNDVQNVEKESVKTGDQTNMVLPVVLLGISAIGIVYAIRKKSLI